MASVTINLYTRFEVTVDGDSTEGGSLTTAKQITAANGHVYDRTFNIKLNQLTELWSDSIMSPETDKDHFEFLWIETDTDGDIQLVCNEGGTIAGSDMESGFVLGLKAGVPFVLGGDDGRNLGDNTGTMNESNYATEIDTWETNWAADTLDRIEWYGAAATVRIVAIN